MVCYLQITFGGWGVRTPVLLLELKDRSSDVRVVSKQAR